MLNDVSFLRHRKVVSDEEISFVFHSACPDDPSKSGKSSAAPRKGGMTGHFPSVAFAVAYLCFVASGVTCAIFPPSTLSEVDSIPIPDDAKCFRAMRHADYLMIEVHVGSPGRRLQTLVRFDSVVNETTTAPYALRVFESQITQSATALCNSTTGSCSDVVMSEDGLHVQGFKRHVADFLYSSEAAERGTAKVHLKAEAELKLRRGFEYWLTSSHFCFLEMNSSTVAPSASVSDATTLVGHVDVSTGQTRVRDHDLARVDVLQTSFARNVTASFTCDLGTEVRFLPLVSYVDKLFLSLMDAHMYADPEAVERRRRVVEVGPECAASIRDDADFEQEVERYTLDCTALNLCSSHPSLPFFRVSTFNMHLRVDHEAAGTDRFVVRFEPNDVMASIPSLAQTTDLVVIGTAKLVLIIIAASLVWVRAGRATSKPHWMYKHCVRLILCTASPDKNSSSMSLLEDAVLGLFCIGCRFFIAFWRLGVLSEDGQSRVCYMEIVCSSLSLSHWVLRNVVLSPTLYDMVAKEETDPNGPLTRLGGSTALIDVTGSVLLAFSDPPTLVSTFSRFDPTGRVLICALVALVAVPRSLYAVCCCSVLFEAGAFGYRPESGGYLLLLAVSAALWCIQCVGLGVMLADLIVTPFSISTTRSLTGGTFWVRLCLFLGAVSFGVPRLMMHVSKLRRALQPKKKN